MRPLKVANYNKELESNEEYKNLMTAAMQKCIDRYAEEKLLEAVRNGDAGSIPALVESAEPIIMLVIRQLGVSQDIQELFDEGRKALTDLAQHEINATGREKFFRFGAWHVRQAILKYLEQKKL